MTPTIRAYEPRDRAAVVELSLRAWAPVHDSMREVMGREIFDLRHRPDWRTIQRNDVESVLADEKATIWVAEQDGAVVGLASAILHVDEQLGQLQMMAVDPDHQNRGLGTDLTNLATDWMREAGMTHAVISTGGDPGHAPARRTYEKAGYSSFPAVHSSSCCCPKDDPRADGFSCVPPCDTWAHRDGGHNEARAGVH